MYVSYWNGLRSGFSQNWYKLPNILTEIRLIGSPVTGILLLIWPNDFYHRMLIVTIFCCLAATDMLDGFAARVLNQRTEFGRLLDPIADALFGSLTLVALAARSDLAMVLLSMSVARQLVIFYVASSMKRQGKMLKVTLSGKVKTVMQLIATVVLLLPDGIVSQSTRIVIVTLAALLILMSIDSYVKQKNS